MFSTLFSLPFFNSIFKYAIIFLIIILIFSSFFVPIAYMSNFPLFQNDYIKDHYQDLGEIASSYGFVWPIPGYSRISSYFGKRNSPTNGASSYHSGIDVPALEDSNLYAIVDGKIIFAGWGAGGGYTITLQSTNYSNITISYCHVSPNLIVCKDEIVSAKQLIGYVGPKNVYDILNNPYKDYEGNPTNGATTGCHLHLTIKENNTPVNPLKFFSFK